MCGYTPDVHVCHDAGGSDEEYTDPADCEEASDSGAELLGRADVTPEFCDEVCVIDGEGASYDFLEGELVGCEYAGRTSSYITVRCRFEMLGCE